MADISCRPRIISLKPRPKICESMRKRRGNVCTEFSQSGNSFGPVTGTGRPIADCRLRIVDCPLGKPALRPLCPLSSLQFLILNFLNGTVSLDLTHSYKPPSRTVYLTSAFSSNSLHALYLSDTESQYETTCFGLFLNLTMPTIGHLPELINITT